MSTVETIKQKVKSLQDELQKKNTYLSNINDALKKLSNDRESTIAEIHTIQGVVHGYSESVKLIQETCESKSDGTTTSL